MRFRIPVSRMRKGMAFGAFIISLIAFGGLTAFAAISLSTTTAAILNFDSIGTSATAARPTDFRAGVTATSTAPDVRKLGTFAAAVSQAARVGGANLSTSAANGVYNFGAGTTTIGSNRAIGFLASGSATAGGNLCAHFTNGNGAPFRIADLLQRREIPQRDERCRLPHPGFNLAGVASAILLGPGDFTEPLNLAMLHFDVTGAVNYVDWH